MSRWLLMRFGRLIAAAGLVVILVSVAYQDAAAQRALMAGRDRGVTSNIPGIKRGAGSEMPGRRPIHRPGRGVGRGLGAIGIGIGVGLAIDAINKSQASECPDGTVQRNGRCVKTAECSAGQTLSRGHCCPKGTSWLGKTCGTKEAVKCPPGTTGRPPKCTRPPVDKAERPAVIVPPALAGETPRVSTVPPGYLPPSSGGATQPPADQPGGNAAVPTDVDPPLFRPAEIVVMIRSSEPDNAAQQLAQAFNLNLQETIALGLLSNARLYRFSIPDNRSVTGLAAAMANAPNVASATPNYYHRLQGEVAAAPKEAASVQYALPKLRVPDARALVSGRGVTVAVIDSGVDTSHPVLKGANVTLLDAVDEPGGAPDKHGTAITGIIAAQGGEVAGIAPGAKILAVRAFAPEKEGGPPVTTSMRLARAVDTAFEQGARVFNMSFAGPRDPLLIAMIDAAHAEGAIFVAAAGNNGPKAPPAFPAAYEKVIAITATDEGDRLYTHANRGEYVDAAAPGVDILVPVTGASFDYLSGTSFAAAHISGIVALIMERNPHMTSEQVQQVLTKGAHDLGAKDFGAGLADAYASLMLATKR